MALFEIEGIDELVDDFKLIQRNYPKEIRKFMMREGNKLKKLTLQRAEGEVEKVTGNYVKGIKRGKYYKYDGDIDSIRVYAGSPAFHGHLVEYGHKLPNGAMTKAYHVFKTSADEFQSKYEKDCDKFVDKITEELNG